MFKQIFTVAVLSAFSSLSAVAENLELSSSDIVEGGPLSINHVFKGFGCEGNNQSPQLSWSGAPKGTKSFVVTAYDPDAPTGSGWWHWVAFNIPATTQMLPRDASDSGKMPIGTVEARTDYGTKQFGGACPPPGEVHRYIFTVYALGVEKLNLDASASPALVGFMTKANAIDSDSITAVYTR